jgi:hypothetical protein
MTLPAAPRDIAREDGRSKSTIGFNATYADDGGLELPPKIVQTWLGHGTIALTMDTYGHLFPAAGDVAEVITDLERAQT